MNKKSIPVCFLVGSPRSGTTIIGEILSRHKDIVHFYEPYYIWDWSYGFLKDDFRDSLLLTPKMKDDIKNNFRLFQKKTNANLILEKMPGRFSIEMNLDIFPNAKFIHLLRDGRDVTFSINKEWKKRERIVKKKKILSYLGVLYKSLKLQPLWHFRLKQLLFEIKNLRSLSLRSFFNKAKWKGQPGWGPRFKNWEEYYENHSLVEFNAMQWLSCVENVEQYKKFIPKENFLEIRYENILEDPEKGFEKILNFINLEFYSEFKSKIKVLHSSNSGKWREGFSKNENLEIIKIIESKLKKLKYLK